MRSVSSGPVRGPLPPEYKRSRAPRADSSEGASPPPLLLPLLPLGPGSSLSPPSGKVGVQPHVSNVVRAHWRATLGTQLKLVAPGVMQRLQRTCCTCARDAARRPLPHSTSMRALIHNSTQTNMVRAADGPCQANTP